MGRLAGLPDRQGSALGIYGSGNIGQSVAVFGAPAIVAASGGQWRLPFRIFGGAAAVFGVRGIAILYFDKYSIIEIIFGFCRTTETIYCPTAMFRQVRS